MNETIRVAAAALTEFVDIFRAQVAELRKTELQKALTTWDTTDGEYEALDKLRKELYALLQELNTGILPEMMKEHGVKTISLENVNKRFTVNHRISCSMLDKEAGFEWLKSTGNNALIQPTVNAQTLGAFAKRRIQDEGKEMPVEIFKVSTSYHMSATKL